MPFLVYANLLFILFSLPLISLFPSLFALTRVIDDYFSDDKASNSSLFVRFKTSFLQLWKKSFKFALISLPFVLIIGLDLIILNSVPIQSSGIITFKYALILLSLIVYCIFHFVLYIYANNTVPLKKAVLTGFFLTIKNPGISFLMIVSHLALIGITLFQPGLGLLLLLSAPLYLVNYLCRRLINH